jgi:hypothetical protein
LGISLAHVDRLPALRALAGQRPDATDDRRLELLLEGLGEWARVRRAVDLFSGVAIALGVVAMLAGGWIGVLPVAAGAALVVAARFAWRREVARATGAHRVEELAAGLRRVRQRSEPTKA